MVASPAMNDANASAMISRPPHSAARATFELSGDANKFGMLICTMATSPSVAANDIWKLGCTSASGATASTIIAATASVRNVMARRSTMMAISTTAVMKYERWVATSAPDSRR